MPILFMGVMALAVLTVMGGMLFFAIFKELREPHPPAAAPEKESSGIARAASMR